MPPKKKKKRPDTHLKDYLEERDVLLEFLKVNELRGFCKKLHKTWEALDNEKGLEIEKQKLLSYWKIIDQQIWQIIDEKRELEIFKIDKTFNERMSAISEKKKLLSMVLRDGQIIYNFKKIRLINEKTTRHELLNRQKELLDEAHKAHKKCIIRNYDAFRSFMYSNVVAYKKFLPVFHKFIDQFATLQAEHYNRKYKAGKTEREKHSRNELQMLKRKERSARSSMSRLTYIGDAIKMLYNLTPRGNKLNTALKKHTLRKTKRYYVCLRRKEKELKKKLMQEPKIASVKEVNSRTNILRHIKDLHVMIKKLERRLKSINEKSYEINCDNAIADTNNCNETKFVKEVRKLSLDEADTLIINHMAKKLLPSIKIKSIIRNIRILYYILKHILKSDAPVDGKINGIVNGKKPTIVSLNRSKIFNEEDDLSNPEDNDPFCLNCVPDIHIPGFIPAISMHHTCKDFIKAQKQVKLVDFNNKQPEEQFQLFEQNVCKNRCIRLRLEKCLARNNSHLNNVPISVEQEVAPKLHRYIKNWEKAMKQVLQKYIRYHRFYEIVDEDEEEVEKVCDREVEGEVEERVQGEERVQRRTQEEIKGEQYEREEGEQMEIDKEAEVEDSVSSSVMGSYTSSETASSSFY